MRADLHVHSFHSRQSGSLRFLRSRDCYSPPEAVYRTARARGMDLVTITDHDSIDGCLEFLSRHPDARDFIIGEEISCRLPDGDVEVHFGVYGLDERIHREVQPLRGNAFEVAAYLRDAGVAFCLNHLLHFYDPQLELERYLQLLLEVPALEVRNGTMLPAHNGLVEHLADGFRGRTWGKVGGSDAHTLRRVGTTWTDLPTATAGEFLDGLRAGRGTVGGRHGTAGAVCGDIYGVVFRYIASLAGAGPRDHSSAHRAACLAFSAATLPGQFLPWALAMKSKWRERRLVDDVLLQLGLGGRNQAQPS